ncbi:MAG: sugar ABC transporter substrate-binding protein [Thermomicrobiales bacterium]|nr:sugar ABC transporter substrate-binding protein [Thermomicrobiales bacterium]
MSLKGTNTRLNRRAILQAGGALGLGLALQPASRRIAAAQEATLNYPSWMLGEAGVGDYWKASVDEFQSQHPGVTLATTLIPSAEYEDKTFTQIAAGSTPDIYPAFTNMVPRLMAEDLLEPLDPFIGDAAWFANELPILQVAQRDGQTYGVVLTASPQGLLYNQELLDAAGVGVPETVDEFYDAVLAVKEKTGEWGYIFSMDTAEEQNAYISTMQWVLGFGSDWAQPDATPSANAPETVEAINWQMKMIDSGAVPVGMATLDARNLFKDGKAAFMIDGPWVMTLVKNENPDLYPSIGYAAPPTPTHAAVTGGAFFTIPRASANKELAWEYIAMINQEDWQRRWLEDLVQIPGQSVPASEEYLEENPWVANMIDIAAKYQAGFGYSPGSPVLAVHANEFRKLVVAEIANIWNKSKTVEAGLDDLQQTLVDWEANMGITPGAA